MPQFLIDKSWTLFLDRDGVINRRNFEGYITSIEEFHFLPYVIEGLKLLAPQFSRVVIVTNQQGVGKGIMSISQLEEIHKFMLEEFQKERIYIDGIYIATNLKGTEGDRRKPLPIMALEAQQDFPEINFKKSIMVGDTDSDIEFGKSLGMKTAWIKSKEGIRLQPDLEIENLKELADELTQ